jgi:hypothetical protein
MTLLRKKSVIAGKVESAVGTAESLAAADSEFIAFDLEVNVEGDVIKREAPGTMSMLATIIGGRRVTVSFKIEMNGSGVLSTNPDWANTFLPACGLVADAGNAFALISGAPGTASSGNRTVTLGFYHDGRKAAAAGCMGNVKFNFTMGDRSYAEFTFTGKYVSVTDAALLSPTLPTVEPPRSANLTFSFGGVTPKAASLEINLQNQVQLREDISSGGGESGYCNAFIVGRDPIINIEPDAELVATYDGYGKWIAGTQEAFALTIGGATWNQLAFAAPKAQIETISPGDRDDIVIDSIQYGLKRSAANDDEFTLTFEAGS